MKVSAIVIHEHGEPASVVLVEKRELPKPGPGEARVRMIAAPINPADINVLEGKYPIRPELPGVPGSEGVGEIKSVGPGVEGLEKGMRVLVPHGVGTWCAECNAPVHGMVPVPDGVDDLQAAMMMINPPTAWRMLHDFQTLSAGDWVVQNASNSGVGRAVIQICKSLGIHTANIVRRVELVQELKAEGADAVIVENNGAGDVLRTAIGDGTAKLGLNAVGGESALLVANALSRRGTMVTYGAMGRKPVRIPNGLLIFKNIVFEGFWITQWFRDSFRDEREAMFASLFELAKTGALRAPVAATYGIGQAREAIEHATREARGGKVLFKFS